MAVRLASTAVRRNAPPRHFHAVSCEQLQEQARAAALVQGLGVLGWTEGGKLRVNWRLAEGLPSLFDRYALFAAGSTSTQASGGVTMATDWKKGSTYDLTYGEHETVISSPEQIVLKSDPYRRLSYTWHTYSPEWAAMHGIDEEQVAVWAGRASLQGRLRHRGVRPRGGQADRGPRHAAPDSVVLQGASQGWPAVLASLQTLLETGAPLPS